MNEDRHDDPGMDLMFGPRPVVIKNQGETTHWWPSRRTDLRLVTDDTSEASPRYRIGVKAEAEPKPRGESIVFIIAALLAAVFVTLFSVHLIFRMFQ